MIKIIRSPKSLNDIKVARWSTESARALTKVAVIDDERLPLVESLLAHGFRIFEVGDIPNLDAVSEYGIIICDVRGVGKALNSRFEGAHLLKELRYRYPDKFLILCTGQRNKVEYQPYFTHADASIGKDADSDEWSELLDGALRRTLHPLDRWKAIRPKLLEEGLSAYDLFRVEQGYIDSVLSGSTKPIEEAVTRLESGVQSQLARNMLIGVTKLIAELAATKMIGAS